MILSKMYNIIVGEAVKMKHLRQLRKARGYSQKDLAEKLGVTIAAVSKWETGYTEPSIDVINNLCAVLGSTADYLLDRTDINEATAEVSGARLPKTLRDVGLERVELLREYIDDQGGIHPDVLKELLRLVAEANVLQEQGDPTK